MATMMLRLFDADRKVLTGKADIRVIDMRGGTVVDERDADASAILKLKDLSPADVYEVRVYPARHRPRGRASCTAAPTRVVLGQRARVRFQ